MFHIKCQTLFSLKIKQAGKKMSSAHMLMALLERVDALIPSVALLF